MDRYKKCVSMYNDECVKYAAPHIKQVAAIFC